MRFDAITNRASFDTGKPAILSLQNPSYLFSAEQFTRTEEVPPVSPNPPAAGAAPPLGSEPITATTSIAPTAPTAVAPAPSHPLKLRHLRNLWLGSTVSQFG